MRLAHFGTFDVENYGDLLFPLVLEKRLASFCDEFVHVSPAGGQPLWGDCVRTVGSDAFLREPSPIDGVVVGGGHIVRALPVPLKAHGRGDTTYDLGGVSPFVAYPSLWLGAAYIAARDNVPLCWNGPGVFAGFAPVAAELLRWTASVTDYLAVREEASRRFLEEAGVSREIEVVPDTALEVSRLWSEEEISEAHAEAFGRRNKRVPRRTLAFHVNGHYAGGEAASVAARIDRVCTKLGATAILIAIGPSHGDDEFQRRVAREMSTNPLLIDQPRSLREVAACIARSEAYFGSSLHGMITACSFGKRGVLVASEKVTKYAGFLEHFGLSSWLTSSWAEAERCVDDLFATPDDTWKRILEKADPILDRHWTRMRATLASGDGSPEEAPRASGSKRPAVEQLQSIGGERFGDVTVFQGLIGEYLRGYDTELWDNRAELRDNRAELQRKQDELRNKQDELQDLHGQIRQLHREMEDMQNSRGWKIANGIDIAIGKARGIFKAS